MKRNFAFLSTASLLAVACCFAAAARAEVAGFDNLPLSGDSYWNGSDLSGTLELADDPWFPPATMDVYHGGFSSGGAFFNNNYNATYWSWDGWAYSNVTDATTPGYENQHSAISGGGACGTPNYGVAYVGSYDYSSITTDFAAGRSVRGAYFTNTAYTYFDILQGSGFSKKFGGEDGTDPDWFLLTITGKDAAGATTGAVEFYLADYRFSDGDDDYIIDDWTWMDLTGLGENVKSLEFSLSSSDTGQWGMNTPAYFAMDGLTAVPEPSAFVLLLAATAAALVRRGLSARACPPQKIG